MSSNITFPLVVNEGSRATPGLWNRISQQHWDNYSTIDADASAASTKLVGWNKGSVTTARLDFDHTTRSEKSEIMRISPKESASADFHLQLGHFANTGTSRQNQVMRLGYNISEGGVPVVGSEPASALEFESYWSAIGGRTMETHIAHTMVDDTLHRPLSIVVREPESARNSDSTIQVTMTADKFDIKNSFSTQNFVFLDSLLIAAVSNGGFLKGVNNTKCVQQLNFAGDNYRDLIHLNDSDGVVLGDSNLTINMPHTGKPSSPTATADIGDISWTSQHVYVYVSANSWKRAALGGY